MAQRILQSVYSWIALVVLIIVVITGNSFYVVHTLDEMASLEARLFTTNRVINAVNSLHVALLRAESGQRGYLLTNNENYLTDYTQTLDSINDLIDEAKVSSLASDLPEQVERIDQLLKLTKAKMNGLIKTVELNRNKQSDDALALVETDRGLYLYNEFEALFQQIDHSEREMQQRHLASLVQLRKDSANTLMVSAGSSGLLILAIFMLLKRNIGENYRHHQRLEEINEQLEETVEQRTQELRVYSDELARSNRELEDFAFVASHDLQEPLRKIRAFGDRIDSGYGDALDERGRDFLHRMLTAAERMSTLISDLLAFSRVSTRGKDFAMVELNQVFTNVIGDLEIAIEESGASLHIGELPGIMADRSQIEQVILNLLSNALKFKAPDRAPVISVTCSATEQPDVDAILHIQNSEWIRIQIEDNGIGFEQEFAEKIFAPFQRLHGRNAYKGTGIGLAVCRRIIERHNGIIEAIGTPGQGSRFIITLPVNGQPFTAAQL